MWEFQFAFTNRQNLIQDLSTVEDYITDIAEPKILFKIFSDILDKYMISEVISTIQDTFSNALIAGCTTNGNILNGCYVKNNVIVQCLVFSSPDTYIDVAEFPLTGKSTFAIVEMMKEQHKKRPWIKAVELLTTMDMLAKKPLYSAFKTTISDITIIGGTAFNRDMLPNSSCVFTSNKEFSSNSLVLILYGGEDLHIKTKRIVGWKPLGTQCLITKASDSTIYEIDNKPATELYSKYLNVKNDEYFSSNSIEFPLLCTGDDGYEILRTPVSANSDGSITMFSRIDGFKYARLTYGDPDTILKSVRNGIKEIKAFSPDVINIYSCVARKSFWGNDIDKESIEYQSVAPSFGFFTSGEILTEGTTLNYLNETQVIFAMREGDAINNCQETVTSEVVNTGNVPLLSRLIHFIGVATEELEKAKDYADRANSAKSDFLANMSHEIRTPINAILGFDTMILRQSTDTTVKEYAEDIYTSGQNLLGIINDILDLSKIESGKMELVPAQYRSISVITDVNNMVSVKAADKGLRFILDVDENIPSVLYGDDIRIKQIIVNLVNNAVKYTEHGSVTLSSHIISKTNSTVRLKFSVKDTGMGIKHEDMDKLFEKFQRLDSDKNRSVEGTGLGLNITIQFLHLMNSKLNVKSTYGEGTNFYFEIEQAIVDDTPLGNYEALIKNKKVEYTYNRAFEAPNAHILVVDDNSLNRKVITNLLKQTKVNIDTADGGLSCLDKTAQTKYDLILLDHMMPDLDGVSTLKKIRENPDNPNASTPIIALTANALSGAREEYLNSGFDYFISKPVDPEKLEKVVYNHLPPEMVVSYSYANGDAASKPIDETFKKDLILIEKMCDMLEINAVKQLISKLKEYRLNSAMAGDIEALEKATAQMNFMEVESIVKRLKEKC